MARARILWYQTPSIMFCARLISVTVDFMFLFFCLKLVDVLSCDVEFTQYLSQNVYSSRYHIFKGLSM